jgi:hypothetical protein
VTQSLDWVHHRRALSGINSEKDADGNRNTERQHDRRTGHDGLLIRDEVNNDLRDHEPDDYAEQSAHTREHHGLDQERRMPISRVRSVTVASMMFMIPIPPTKSEIAAIVPRMMLN